MKNAIVIGRHASDIPGFTVVDQKPIIFPTTAEECIPVLEELFEEAYKQNATLLFQNTPGSVTAALTRIGSRNTPTHISVGVVVSKPGERLAGKEYTFDSSLFERDYPIPNDVYYAEVERIAKHCNPNAKVSGFSITVDPPMKFEFSHIEWLFS
jgi:hypothetical protein